jgi:tetratricopeptide (TPR) repeat protein
MQAFAKMATVGMFLLPLALRAPLARAEDSGCGADPNPVYSVDSLIASCTREARGVPEYMSSGGPGFTLNSPTETRAWALYQRGLYYQFTHQYDKAIADFTDAISKKRLFEDAYAARADAHEVSGDHTSAAADYAKAAELKADNADALNERCWQRAIRGYPLDLALADCTASLALHPDEPNTFDSRCLVNYRLGKYADAISDCNAALKENRRASSGLYVRGLAKLRSGDAASGNSDIAAAKDSDRRIEERYAVWGVKP